jgi:hypothetical protein
MQTIEAIFSRPIICDILQQADSVGRSLKFRARYADRSMTPNFQYRSRLTACVWLCRNGIPSPVIQNILEIASAVTILDWKLDENYFRDGIVFGDHLMVTMNYERIEDEWEEDYDIHSSSPHSCYLNISDRSPASSRPSTYVLYTITASPLVFGVERRTLASFFPHKMNLTIVMNPYRLRVTCEISGCLVIKYRVSAKGKLFKATSAIAWHGSSKLFKIIDLLCPSSPNYATLRDKLEDVRISGKSVIVVDLRQDLKENIKQSIESLLGTLTDPEVALAHVSPIIAMGVRALRIEGRITSCIIDPTIRAILMAGDSRWKGWFEVERMVR